MLRALLLPVLAVALVACRQSQPTQVAVTNTPFTNHCRMVTLMGNTAKQYELTADGFTF